MDQLRSLVENAALSADPATLVVLCTSGGVASAVIANSFLHWRRRVQLNRSPDWQALFAGDTPSPARRSVRSSSSPPSPARLRDELSLLREAASPARQQQASTLVRTPSGRHAIFSAQQKKPSASRRRRRRLDIDLDDCWQLDGDATAAAAATNSDRDDDSIGRVARSAVFADWDDTSRPAASNDARLAELERLLADSQAALRDQRAELDQLRQRNAELGLENQLLAARLRAAADAANLVKIAQERDAHDDDFYTTSATTSQIDTIARNLEVYVARLEEQQRLLDQLQQQSSDLHSSASSQSFSCPSSSPPPAASSLHAADSLAPLAAPDSTSSPSPPPVVGSPRMSSSSSSSSSFGSLRTLSPPPDHIRVVARPQTPPAHLSGSMAFARHHQHHASFPSAQPLPNFADLDILPQHLVSSRSRSLDSVRANDSAENQILATTP